MDAAQMLAAGFTRETTIYRDAQGRWFNEGEPLEHGNLTHAFDGWIRRADDGRYCLENDINWAYIQLDGAPYFVRSADVTDDGRVTLHLSGGRQWPLDAASLRQDAEGALYCSVLEQGLPARFDSHAAAQLEPCVHEDAQGVYLALGGERIRPPVVDEPLAAG